MAKRFKFRICRVFQSCRSKDPSTLPSNPVPCFLPEPHRSSLRRHVSQAFESVGCGFSSSRPTLSDADDHRNEPHHDFHWEQQDKWHVVAKVCAAPDNNTTPRRKIYSSSVSAASDDDDNEDVLPLPPPPRAMKKKGRAKKKKTTPRFRMSTSSADSCGLFSSDGHDVIDEEETETLVSSSRSFSTDSSSVELDSHLESICETPGQHQGVKKMKSKSRRRKKKKKSKKKKKDGRVSFSSSSSPARLSMLLRLVPCSVEGKVRESFAVVKRSEDPHEDFRRSMMEMIMEKQIFEDTDLEQLLHCFLSLNSSEHHGVIVQVFAEIWQSLFTSASTTRRDL